jgi:hypothetical protein
MRQPHWEEGEYHFDDFPDFKPNYSPREMISMGVFGGTYFNREEYREMIHLEVFEVDNRKYNLEKQDASVNYYRTLAGNDRQWWEERNLIKHEYNTEGWFQWYCRFYYGRRCDDDFRETDRWVKFRKRQLRMYFTCISRSKYPTNEALADMVTYPRYKQSILQWAIEPILYKNNFL